MYYSQQTLYNIHTLKVVALHPQTKSAFNWDVYNQGGLTELIDENGVVFCDDIRNYTHFEDFFGRAATYTEEKSTNPYVDITLKKYLVFGRERRLRFKQEAEEWYNWIIDKLNEEGHVRCPFADGSHCHVMEKYFIKKIKAKPLYKRISGEKFYVCREYAFKFNNKDYLITDNEIVQVEWGI